MPEFWAIIVSIILVLIIYGIVSSRLKDRKRQKLRARTIPMITEYPTADGAYNIHLSDGRKFLDAKLIGTVEGEDASFSFAGYEGMVVIELSSGKKAFVKKSAIRYLEEA